MKLLDIFSKKQLQESIEHRINPVYDTAKDCLINLVHAQNEEAILLNGELSFTSDLKVDSAIHKGTALFQESRYEFVNNEIKKSCIKNILDIGCGYSPRGILFSQLGYRYVGADLPAAIKEIEPAVKKHVNDDVKYVGVDATNPQSLIEAASLLDGPICIITEGLFMYLPFYELNEYLKGLKEILEIHGGFIVTPDFCMHKLFEVSLAATSNKLIGNLLQIIANKVVKDYTVTTKDKNDSISWYEKEDDIDAYNYFSNQGFIIERAPIYNSEINLNSLAYVKHHKLNKLMNDYKNIYGWKLTINNK